MAKSNPRPSSSGDDTRFGRLCQSSGWPTADTVTHVRLWDNGAAWSQVHLGVDTYDWAVLDQAVAQAQQVWPNVAFTYVISSTPAWLADPACLNDPVGRRLPPASPSPAAFLPWPPPLP